MEEMVTKKYETLSAVREALAASDVVVFDDGIISLEDDTVFEPFGRWYVVGARQ